MRPDFSRLYSQLDIRPDCSLEEFKRACRRRIAELHPDRERAGNAVASAHASSPGHAELPLDDLLALYAKALVFHRRHGRLPGAVPQPTALGGAYARPAGAAGEVDGAAVGGDDTGAPQRGPLFTVVAIVLVLVGIGAWKGGTPPQVQAAPALAESRAGHIGTALAEPALLELGMDTVSVRAIQGEPMQVRGDVWEYGPSWLMFERRRLVDWHSSPLRPLKAATAAPPEQPEQPGQR